MIWESLLQDGWILESECEMFGLYDLLVELKWLKQTLRGGRNNWLWGGENRRLPTHTCR